MILWVHLNTEFTNQQTNTKAMKFAVLVLTTTLLAASITSAAATVTIPIPRPPVSGTPKYHGMTRQQCFNQAYSVWQASLRNGVDRQVAGRRWAKNVEQCKALPAKMPKRRAFDPGDVGSPNTPQPTGTGTRKIA